MILVEYLKYILPLTILFDAVVSVFFIRKSFQNKTIRFYFLTLITLVGWEVFFWFGIYTNYGVVGNDIIDRFTFFCGIVSQFLLMEFLLRYIGQGVNFVIRIVRYTTLLFSIILLLFGIGERHYTGSLPYNYYQGTDFYSSVILSTYSFLSIVICLICFYLLARSVHPNLSFLEMARRKLIRNSIGFSLAVTLIPLTIVPLSVLLLGEGLPAMLASNWYIQLIVFAAIFSSVWTGATAYALTRYRLFDVTVRIRRSLLLVFGIVVLASTVILLDQLVFIQWFSRTEALVALISSFVVALTIMAWYARKVGFGEPLSLAVLEPVQPDTTVQELAGKLQRYLASEFNITTNAIYIVDVATKQFGHSETGAVLTLSTEIMTLLQNNQKVSENLQSIGRPGTVLVPLVHNGFLIGWISTEHTVSDDIYISLQPFVGLIYQALFASYLKTV